MCSEDHNTTDITPLVRRLWPMLALAGAATAWGSTFAVNKAALAEVGPFTILITRFPLALAVLVAVAWRRGLRLSRLLHPRLLLFGLPLALHFSTQTAGLAFTSASRGALIVAAIPMATALAAALILGERLSKQLWIGITLSVVGVVVLIGVPTSAASGRLLGDLLVAASVIAWALYTVHGRHLASTHSALETTLASTMAATFLLLPAAAAEWSTSGPPVLQPSTAVLLIYLGLIPSALAFLAWNWALSHLSASTAGPFTNLVPVTGVAFAFVLGETLSTTEVAGIAIVATGLWVANRHGRRRHDIAHQESAAP